MVLFANQNEMRYSLGYNSLVMSVQGGVLGHSPSAFEWCVPVSHLTGDFYAQSTKHSSRFGIDSMELCITHLVQSLSINAALNLICGLDLLPHFNL